MKTSWSFAKPSHMDETLRHLPAAERRQRRRRGLCAIGMLACAAVAAAAEPTWTPTDWAQIDTLELLTTGPEEGEHWSKLWLVVVDGELYVRLGTKAAERVRQSTTHPYVSVKIAGRQFDRVRIADAPDFRRAVADAMAEKYLTDLLIRFFHHPMTARLTPDPHGVSGP